MEAPDVLNGKPDADPLEVERKRLAIAVMERAARLVAVRS